MSLVACPFCRELYEPTEASRCPVCGVPLRPLAELPPSYDALNEEAPKLPEQETLPWYSFGRGRGPLLILAVLGLACFFAPWFEVSFPSQRVLSGLTQAKRLGWPWAAAVAWFVLIPAVMSRRTIHAMQAGRVAIAFLAAMPAVTALIFLLRTPTQNAYFIVRYTHQWGLVATLVLSLAALVFALRLGGRRDVVVAPKGSSEGETLH